VNSRVLSVTRIATGLLFFEHGAEKLWGFAGGQVDHNFLTLHGFAGPLEVTGGTLITFGLLTRLTAFLLCGQMAVAYFDQWAGRGLFPISNGGEEAVIFCFHVFVACHSRSRTVECRSMERRGVQAREPPL